MSAFLRFGKKTNRFDNYQSGDIEPHEIFYDSLAKKHEEQLDISEKKFEISLSKSSLRVPLILALVFFIFAIGRVIQLQTVQGADLRRLAEQNKYLFYKVQSDRGIIYDKDFNPLVANLSTFDLECDKSKMPTDPDQRKKIAENLAKIIDTNADDIARNIESAKMPTVENLNHQALIVLEARIGDFAGCAIAKRPIRNYVADAGLSHLLGYMGKIGSEEWQTATDFYSMNDYIGRDGLEKNYEKTLRKNPGKLRVERDAKGNVVGQNIDSAPESGDSLQLWLDSGLQKKLNDSLRAQLDKLGLKRASAVALDPKTGGVLAMVSFPDYDNNAFSASDSKTIQQFFEDKDNPLLNRVIQGQYLTGSSIKPFEAAGALQEKIISSDKAIDCPGKITVPNRYNPEIIYTYNDNHIHGITDMRKAIAESCNVYFWTIGGGFGNQKGLGPTRIKKYLELFGWGNPTSIDLPGESSGFIPTPDWKKERFKGTQDEVWSDGNTYNLAIGQEFIGITPIQVASAYAAIANGGTLFKPQMVQKIVDASRNVIEEKKPVAIRQNFIDPQNLQVVREGMRHGVNGAGAPLASSLVLNSLGIPMASKTGTAQVRKGADGKDIMTSWVNVFAPYDDPKIVLTIMMEDVHEGQLAVLPVAKDVLGWYFTPQEQRAAAIQTTETPGAGPDSEANSAPPAAETPSPVLPESDPADADNSQTRIEQQLKQIEDQVNKLKKDAPAAP